MIDKNLKSLFLAHRRELQAYLSERLRDREIAADLTQETFLRFAEQGEGAAAVIGHSRAYLYRTARNLAIDHLRRVERQATDVAASEDFAHVPEIRPGPEEVTASRERLAELAAAVRKLPERTRHVFVLHRIDGLTYGEIAARLGVSESSVQKHLARALHHVMRRVKPDKF